ncbi:MAG: glycosyltransferase family 9 protein [Deltaproteobacteria bacterium]|nr:glycosyltransferase family 9 protein [Deltaproteobacteria bacterium]
MKGLVLCLAKLGDFIQATPLIRDLSLKTNELYLVAAQNSVAEAARLSGLVTEVFTIDPRNPEPNLTLPSIGSGPLCNLSMAPAALSVLEKIRAQNLKAKVYGPRLHHGALSLPIAQEVALAVLRVNRRYSPFNLVDVWRSLTPKPSPEAKLYWPLTPKGVKGQERPQERPKVGFILGAGNARRRWPRENYTALGQKLMEIHNAQVVLLGDQKERALGKAVSLTFGSETDFVNLVGQTNLAELAATLSELDLLIGPDTGGLHLGAAINVPIIGLYFGPALAHETGPYGPNHLVAQTLAPCGPCPESRPCPERVCLAIPTVDEVYAAVKRLWVKDNADFDNEALGIVNPDNRASDKQAADKEGPSNEDPGSNLYTTSLDAFGYKLSPMNPINDPDLLKTEFLREVARATVDPDYTPLRPERDLDPGDKDFWRALTERIWPPSAPRKLKERFIEVLGQLRLLP